MVDAVRMQGAVRVPHGEVDTLADEFVAAHIEQIALAVDGFEGFVWKADGGGGFLIRFGEKMRHENNLLHL